MKSLFRKVLYFGFANQERTDANQKTIRDFEWSALRQYMVRGGRFLDVGAGQGYAMARAATEAHSQVFGIDPEPKREGAPPDVVHLGKPLSIVSADAESLPFRENLFDVVFCSHVLEHVHNPKLALSKMKRVLKNDGVLIIGMPTAMMACIRWITVTICCTHLKILRFLRGNIGFTEIWLPASHGTKGKSILHDLRHYRVTEWSKLIRDQWVVSACVLPGFYSFAEFVPFVRPRPFRSFSSSVFFICQKTVPSCARDS